jgi:BspA type Leucine rich repeat region (6 copies)
MFGILTPMNAAQAIGTLYNGTSGDVACSGGGFFTILNNVFMENPEATSAEIDCKGDIVIPSGVTRIEDGATLKTSNQITSVVIPNSVTYIGHTAFPWPQFTTVRIPNGVTVLGNDAFNYGSLTTFDYCGTLLTADDFLHAGGEHYTLTCSTPRVTVAAGPVANSKVASIPSGLTTAVIPATASLPATSLNFGGTVPTAVTVVPVTTNPASAASTPFTISGSTKIVDIQISGTFTGSATVCLDGAETDHLFHFTGGAWVELPSRSYVGGQVCGVTTSFSPFAAAPPAAVSLVASTAAADAAAKAAAEAAAAKREAEKQAARADITSKLKSAKDLTVDAFAKAEIPGITATNIAAVQAELLALPESTRTDINQVLKIAHKYEVVGNIGSDQINYMQSNSFIEIGLIPADSKNKVALVAAVRSLPEGSRDTYAEIKTAIDAEMARIQARKDRLVAAITRNSNRYTK